MAHWEVQECSSSLKVDTVHDPVLQFFLNLYYWSLSACQSKLVIRGAKQQVASNPQPSTQPHIVQNPTNCASDRCPDRQTPVGRSLHGQAAGVSSPQTTPLNSHRAQTNSAVPCLGCPTPARHRPHILTQLLSAAWARIGVRAPTQTARMCGRTCMRSHVRGRRQCLVRRAGTMVRHWACVPRSVVRQTGVSDITA